MRVLFILFLGLLACQNNEKGAGHDTAGLSAELKPLYEEVLTIHDEVMPEMSKLTQLQNQTTELLQQRRAETPVDTDKLKETNQVLGQLNRAESAMWDWMHGFGALDSIPADKKQSFLMEQKLSAENMRDLVLNSIKEASDYVQKNATETTNSK
jgi:hypothetical protein